VGTLKNVAIALDQALNCCIKLSDGWGTPDEMLSARAWRLRIQHPSLRVWIDRLFFWDDDHCQECYQIERNRDQLDTEYR
jgi:hypothetical protein